jgi:hypothetical protein
MRRGIMAAAALLALAGCGAAERGVASPASESASSSSSERPALPASTTEAEPSEPAEPTGPEENERGNLEAEFGDEGFLTDMATDEPMITFSVDDIVVDLPCTAEFAEPAENGHLIGVKMRFSTAPELPAEEWYFTVSGYDFTFIGSDGVTTGNLETIATYSCLNESEMLTSDALGPGQKYTGTVVLDVPEPSGTLIYTPSGLSDGGYEWQF